MNDFDNMGCHGTGMLPAGVACEGCPDCDPDEEQWASDLTDEDDEA